MGATDISPLNLSDFKSEELKRLNEDLLKILEDYCGKEEGLKQLQKSVTEEKALERWQNTGDDKQEKNIQDSKYQLGY